MFGVKLLKLPPPIKKEIERTILKWRKDSFDERQCCRDRIPCLLACPLLPPLITPTQTPRHRVIVPGMPPSVENRASSFAEFGCERWPLHYACRVGNLEHVRYLVDVWHCAVNEQDAHDATPLYLAALTGHNEICRFLLERGAKCDPDSGGDAARVFYVALTPELRRMLREWSLTAASRDPFLDSLRRSFNDPTHADCVWSPHMPGKPPVYIHRIILHARCPRLDIFMVEPAARNANENSNSNGAKQLSRLVLENDNDNDHEHYEIMVQLLEYLYTGTLDARNEETAVRARALAATFDLQKLYEQLDAALAHHSSNNNNDNNEKHPQGRFRCEISDLKSVRRDMTRVAQFVSTPHAEMESLTALGKVVEWSDVTVQCLDCTWSLNCFRVCGQSEYFDRALLGSFREAQDSFLDLSNLAPSSDVFRLVIQWMYSDTFLDTPSLEMAIEVLELGFAILCPRLSTHVANNVLTPAVDRDCVFEMLELARMHGFERLEDQCVQVIGSYLQELAHRPELRAVLAGEAAGIVQGGDIQVIDVPIAGKSPLKLARTTRTATTALFSRVSLYNMSMFT
jgi:ankyrin repeat protein